MQLRRYWCRAYVDSGGAARRERMTCCSTWKPAGSAVRTLSSYSSTRSQYTGAPSVEEVENNLYLRHLWKDHGCAQVSAAGWGGEVWDLNLLRPRDMVL